MDSETKKNPSKRNKEKERKAIYEKNMELYNRFLSGNEEERNEIRNELLILNEKYFYKLISKNLRIRKSLNIETEDMLSILKIAFIEVLEKNTYSRWSTKIWYKTIDKAKDMMCKQYSAGGINTCMKTLYKNIKSENQKTIMSGDNDFIETSIIMFDAEDEYKYKCHNEDVDEIFSCIDRAIKEKMTDKISCDIVFLKASGFCFKEIALKYDITEACARKKYERAKKAIREVKFYFDNM